MSLSPLFRALTNDLHVSTARPTSIAVSSDFVVARNRSPPFGFHRICSRSRHGPEDRPLGGALRDVLVGSNPVAAFTQNAKGRLGGD